MKAMPKKGIALVTGFGLAITRDLAVATGSRLRLSASSSGGLRATIEWGAK